jgi:hypothetical protein
MSVEKKSEMTKIMFYFALLVFGLEIYFWEEIYNNIMSIDYMTIIKTIGLYSVVKLLLMYGIIEVVSTFIVKKVLNKYVSEKTKRKIIFWKIKISRKIKLRARWQRYMLWEKIIIFFALLQVAIAIIGVLFYIPMTRKQAVKITAKKIGKKILLAFFAIISVTGIKWIISLPVVTKTKEKYKNWRENKFAPQTENES